MSMRSLSYCLTRLWFLWHSLAHWEHGESTNIQHGTGWHSHTYSLNKVCDHLCYRIILTFSHQVSWDLGISFTYMILIQAYSYQICADYNCCWCDLAIGMSTHWYSCFDWPNTRFWEYVRCWYLLHSTTNSNFSPPLIMFFHLFRTGESESDSANIY